MSNNVYLPSKPRYDILDGLRGVAAMIVVAYHLIETYYHCSPSQPINHGYLAVDFFFALSGFVIGYAYDDRWGSMSTWSFIKRRLIRLHPLLVFGTLFGAALFYFTDGSSFPLVSAAPWYMVLLVTLWACTIIPLPASLDIRGWSETNPLNGPVWSLQWEYFANLLYAFIFRHLSKAALAVCVLFFAAMTVVLCFNIDVLGYLSVRNSMAHTVIGGWCLTPDQLQIGLTRLLYPFFSGLLLARLGWLIRVKGGFWWSTLLIVAVLAMPWMGLSEEGSGRWTNGLYEALCILLMFPLIVSIGAGSTVTGRLTTRLCKFLGEISYPLYVTHFPLVCLQITWVNNHPDSPLGTHVFVSVSIFVLAIAMAYASYRLYDVPVRAWLRKRLFKQAD